jgi:hypothetical protein
MAETQSSVRLPLSAAVVVAERLVRTMHFAGAQTVEVVVAQRAITFQRQLLLD